MQYLLTILLCYLLYLYTLMFPTLMASLLHVLPGLLSHLSPPSQSLPFSLKPLSFPRDTFSDCPRKDSSVLSLNSYSISYFVANFRIFKGVYFHPPYPDWRIKEIRNQGNLKLNLQPEDTKSKASYGPDPANSSWLRMQGFLERF